MDIPKYTVKYRGKKFMGNNEGDLYNNIISKFPDASEDEVNRAISFKVQTKGFMGDANKNTFIPHKDRKISFKDALTGVQAIVKIVKGEFVDQAEINRRAILCTNCPQKSLTTDCYGCGFASRLTAYVNKVKKETFGTNFVIPNDLQGKYCGVCQCALLVMLPSKMSAFEEDAAKQDLRPKHCWVKKDSINYKPE